jgi:hypothetical protein
MGYPGASVLISFCYLVLRRLLQLAPLRGRPNDFKELEIVVLRHGFAILRRQRKRPALTSRPALSRSSESVAGSGTLAVVPDHASEPALVASAIGGETVARVERRSRPTS